MRGNANWDRERFGVLAFVPLRFVINDDDVPFGSERDVLAGCEVFYLLSKYRFTFQGRSAATSEIGAGSSVKSVRLVRFRFGVRLVVAERRGGKEEKRTRRFGGNVRGTERL